MRKALHFLYGVLAYAVSFGSFNCAIAFVGDVLVPKTINAGGTASLGVALAALFAAATTGYILVAVQLEEHDLVERFGDRYRDYRRQVPAFFPLLNAGYEGRERAGDETELPAGA